MYLHDTSQEAGSAGTIYNNIRFRGGVAALGLCDHIGGEFRSSDAYWKSIGLSVERLSKGLFMGVMGMVQTVRFVFDSTPNCNKCLDGMP